MTIDYKINEAISADQFIELLKDSSLAERRPIDDKECVRGMLANGNLAITAWSGDKLVGIARSITDFHYACYLSDLAVAKDFQNSGIGKKLIQLTREQLGHHCMLNLISAPNANAYYGHIGMTHNPRCWTLKHHDKIS